MGLWGTSLGEDSLGGKVQRPVSAWDQPVQGTGRGGAGWGLGPCSLKACAVRAPTLGRHVCCAQHWEGLEGIMRLSLTWGAGGLEGCGQA